MRHLQDMGTNYIFVGDVTATIGALVVDALDLTSTEQWGNAQTSMQGSKVLVF